MKREFDKKSSQDAANMNERSQNEKYLRGKRGPSDLSDGTHASKVYYVDSMPDVDQNKIKWDKQGDRGYASQAFGYDY